MSGEAADYERRVADEVAAHGLCVVTVDDAAVPFAYTVGQMFAGEHPGPEMVLFGLEAGLAGTILRGMAKMARAGVSFAPGPRFTGVLEGRLLATRVVHPSQCRRYLGMAVQYGGSVDAAKVVEALQVFWPDVAGRFPFDDGCEPAVAARQPRLDEPAVTT